MTDAAPADRRRAADPPETRRTTEPETASEEASKTHALAQRKPSGGLGRLLRALGRFTATLMFAALGLLGVLVIWDAYTVSPWTRDGRVRAQVASVAPEVSGRIDDVRVSDNQFVRKGDVLYVVEPFDFQISLDSAKTNLAMKAADLQVKQVQSERRQRLSDLATTPEEQQQYAGNAAQALAAYDAAQEQVRQAQINLERTEVKSPVDGYVTNLLMRVGDYAHTGTTNVSVIDANSFWIDGYFEETKLARVCVGDRAEAHLIGYRDPIGGVVETVTRGISVSDAAPSTQGLPDVNPIYTWVRLAQRVPVRLRITSLPPNTPLVIGMTATVTITDPRARRDRWWDRLRERARDLFGNPTPRADCIPSAPSGGGDAQVLTSPTAVTPTAPSPSPALAPGMAISPQKR